jgi:hypothetical protein
MSVKYYLADGRQTRGPFEKDELEREGLRRDTLVWRKGLADWQAAGQTAELVDIFDEPPPLPGAPAPAPPAERPPLPTTDVPAMPNLDIGSGSEQIKDPAVAVPRAEVPRAETPRHADRPPRYRDEEELPHLGRPGVRYDALGIRRLYLGGASVYFPGVVLALLFLVSLAVLGIYGFERNTQVFDPQRKQIVTVFNNNARSMETLCGIGLVASAVLSVICLSIGAACFFVLINRAWAIIQDGRLRPSPGMAVGFLFIPFFNVYWVWVGIWGLARALNRYVRRYDLDAPPASQALGFTISLYSDMTYIPFPFAGLWPLALNVILFPFYMRSIARTAAAICEDANRERIAAAPLERSLRQPILERPVSAHILSIVAPILTLIALGMMVPGFCIGLESMRRTRSETQRAEALQQGIRHLRGLGNLAPNDQQRLRDFENQARNIEQFGFHARDDLMISTAVFGGGVIFLVIAVALASVARLCAQVSEERTPPPLAA